VVNPIGFSLLRRSPELRPVIQPDRLIEEAHYTPWIPHYNHLWWNFGKNFVRLFEHRFSLAAGGKARIVSTLAGMSIKT